MTHADVVADLHRQHILFLRENPAHNRRSGLVTMRRLALRRVRRRWRATLRRLAHGMEGHRSSTRDPAAPALPSSPRALSDRW